MSVCEKDAHASNNDLEMTEDDMLEMVGPASADEVSLCDDVDSLLNDTDAIGFSASQTKSTYSPKNNTPLSPSTRTGSVFTSLPSPTNSSSSSVRPTVSTSAEMPPGMKVFNLHHEGLYDSVAKASQVDLESLAAVVSLDSEPEIKVLSFRDTLHAFPLQSLADSRQESSPMNTATDSTPKAAAAPPMLPSSSAASSDSTCSSTSTFATDGPMLPPMCPAKGLEGLSMQESAFVHRKRLFGASDMENQPVLKVDWRPDFRVREANGIDIMYYIKNIVHTICMWSFSFFIVHNIIWFLFVFVAGIALFVHSYNHEHWFTVVVMALASAGYTVSLADTKKFLDPFRSSISRYAQTHWLWNYPQEWGHCEFIRLAKLDYRRQYGFMIQPHAILLHSRLALWGGAFNELFPGVKIPVVLAASMLFSIPGSRELCDWLGAINARRRSAVHALKQGANVAVYPGGTAEILTTDAESPATTLLCRSGFLRLSIQNGVPVVPVFVFGEKYMYDRITIPTWISTAVYNLFKAPLILFGGWGWTWLPNRRPLTVIYGKPIEVKKNEHPTEEEVHDLLKLYMQQQVDIYNVFKENMGYGEEQYLEIVEAREKTKKN